MVASANTSLFSELLMSAHIVNCNDLSNAAQVAAKTGLPLGRILVMLAFATNETVNAAMEAEWLVRDQVVSLDTAKRAMSLVAGSGVSIHVALNSLKHKNRDGTTGNAGGLQAGERSNLGELLVAAQMIDSHQLAEATAMSQHLGLPLGRILVLKGVLNQSDIESALNMQILLRDGKINRKKAIEALTFAFDNQCELEAAFLEMDLQMCVQLRCARLGEMLVLAGVVSEVDMLTALEVSLLNDEPIGQVMLNLGFIAEDILAAGLVLQGILGHESLSLREAVEALSLIHTRQIGLIEAICEAYSLDVGEVDDLGLLDLLQRSSLVARSQAEKALAISVASRQSFVDMLIRHDLIDEDLLSQAIKCQLLVKENLIDSELAVPALRYCEWSGLDLASILYQLDRPTVDDAEEVGMLADGFAGSARLGGVQEVSALQHSWH